MSARCGDAWRSAQQKSKKEIRKEKYNAKRGEAGMISVQRLLLCRNRKLGEHVEERRFAYIRHTDDSHLQMASGPTEQNSLLRFDVFLWRHDSLGKTTEKDSHKQFFLLVRKKHATKTKNHAVINFISRCFFFFVFIPSARAIHALR